MFNEMRMRQFITSVILTIFIVLSGANPIFSQTKTKRTIHVEKAGTLSSYISDEELYEIEELTLTGEINGSDFSILRNMAGRKSSGKDYRNYGYTDGKLTFLDISGTKIVAGGKYMRFSNIDNSVDYELTNNDEIPPLIFDGCSGLSTIKIPESVNSIGSYALNGTAWYNNQPDGLVYMGNILYSYKGDMPQDASITIKDGTTSIACSAFEKKKELSSIIIPNSVTRIGSSTNNYTFDGWRGYGGAFAGCKKLSKVILPNSVESIGWFTFRDCSSLTNITFGSGTKVIDHRAFDGVDLQIIVSLIEDPFEIDGKSDYEGSFSEKTFDDATLYVPVGSINKYKTTRGWKDFAHIKEGIGDDSNVKDTKANAIMVKSDGEKIIISGIETGSLINIYNVAGQIVYSTTASQETTVINPSLQNGEIAIVKIGEESFKILISK